MEKPYLQELYLQVLASVIETGKLHLVQLFLSRSQESSKFRQVIFIKRCNLHVHTYYLKMLTMLKSLTVLASAIDVLVSDAKMVNDLNTSNQAFLSCSCIS